MLLKKSKKSSTPVKGRIFVANRYTIFFKLSSTKLPVATIEMLLN